ncbi:adenomatous polyposis coli protein 2 [Polypterus senegalus]|uniref:adenomatous polyposis coli protein 2 n=1 Tax=Polypterus senegalus TaxID=55291 RepID=UPI001965F762|nr:adenomatous polyposis coli protein 2 [Polypterus senegalus]
MVFLWLSSLLQSTLFGDEILEQLKMANSETSYDQLVHQVEALRKENSHLRRELEDNTHHLTKLETETSDMKEVLKQLQGKLEQEARSLASSGRADVLEQLKELHMDLTAYYELKCQPHNLRCNKGATVSSESLLRDVTFRGGGGGGGAGGEGSPPYPDSRQSSSVLGEGGALHAGTPQVLEGTVHKSGPSGEDYVTAQHLEELEKERILLLREIEKEEKERHWYYSQLQGLSRRLAELPHIDTFSLQMDLIRQQLEFEANQLRSVMEERFGTSDEMVQRTQIRAARLEQLEKEMQDVQEKIQHSDGQAFGSAKLLAPELENTSNNPTGPEATSESGNKVEMVFWLLSMLATRDREEMSRTLLAMSSSQESCLAMRKSGCMPLLVQILHDGPAGGEAAGRCTRDSRSRASAALHNIVYSQPDEGQARREMRVLHILEQIRAHCESGWDWLEGQHKGTTDPPDPIEPQICQAMCAIMKLSFEEEYRRAMNELGGLQAVAELLELDHEMHSLNNDPLNVALRRYAGMALTNLTFGDVVNKATLCSKKSCLQAVVAQLASDSEELHQVVSSILRNLSWRADINSKKILRDVGCVSGLMTCVLRASKESTLKSLLSALWNLSAHSTENKVAICSVEGALAFLVSTLTYKCQSNSLAIIESGGGILRNVSSLVATREDYRQILRDHNCLQTLLQHLRSHSLTIVSNACGTLWNLSARSPQDQELLWDLGAVSMLRNLINSKHKMIAMGSAAALRNLLTNRPLKYKDAAVISPGSCMPSLYMRKQKALEAELDAKNLSETFDTIDKQQSPKLTSINKPLRHIENLAKDYASDSGCFDDDEAPNISSGLDTGGFSVLSMYMNSSNFLQMQPRRKEGEFERDLDSRPEEGKKLQPSDDEVSQAAEQLAKKITKTVAKIDKLVEDISTLNTSSEDSFSLSSEDHFMDWHYGSDDLHEARAKSCSPCRLSDTSSFARRERLSKAHALLRLKTAYTSLSTDSLNSGSTSDGYSGGKEQVRPSARSAAIQRRPNRLELKVAQQGYTDKEPCPSRVEQVQAEEQQRATERKDRKSLSNQSSTDLEEKCQEPPPPTPATDTSKISSEASVPTIKLSPSYQYVPLIQSMSKYSVARQPVSPQAPPGGRRHAWLPTVTNSTILSKLSPMGSIHGTPLTQMETLQKYSVENTPICFSRCSSLSSLSSGDGALDGQSQSDNELDSDSSLEIIEVDECEADKTEDNHLETPGEESFTDNQQNQFKGSSNSSTSPASQPIEIPSSTKREKLFLRETSPGRQDDMTPSSSSENYIHETPLMMSRCSSVSSLGSFESPSIASSVQSDPCSEMISGTISPSDLPDSPGQTMPPSRSKTPCCMDTSGPERESAGQWECNFRKFLEIADFKERFNFPPDLDTMIYFTVEKPTENFSCASSLSALPLHEHYIQKDVELKLMPLFHEKDSLNFGLENRDSEEAGEGRAILGLEKSAERGGEGNSDDDIEILKECINSAMPSKFKKVKTSLMSSLSAQVLHNQARKSMQMPVYMLLPTHAMQVSGAKNGRPEKEFFQDDSSFTDSADLTPVNFSSATSLSDETLHYSVKDDFKSKRKGRQDFLLPVQKGMQEALSFPHLLKSANAAGSTDVVAQQVKMVGRKGNATRGTYPQAKDAPSVSSLSRDRSPAQSSQVQTQAQPKDLHKLNLPIIKPKSTLAEKQHDNQSNLAFPSFCHTTPTEEAVYCFYDTELMGPEVSESSKKPTKEASRVVPTKPGACVKTQGFTWHKGVSGRLPHTNIMDETPPCYSLSSSLSSLSDMDLDEQHGKIPQMWSKYKHQHQGASKVDEEDSSLSSVSLESEDDLLQKCITSAMPKQNWLHLGRRKKNGRKEKSGKTSGNILEDWGSPKDNSGEGESDKDSDLNSMEWQAIQEGANSVVTRLKAASHCKEPDSDVESVLSFISGLSMGSTLQMTREKREGMQEEKERKEHSKILKKTESRDSRKPLDFGQRKPVPNLPVVFRGRTVIYMPNMKKTADVPPRTDPKKTSPKTETPSKNPSLAQQRSRSLHRLGQPHEKSELSLPKRSSTPPARMSKVSSSGSSRNSTPSRHPQKKLTSPSLESKPSKTTPSPVERKANGTTPCSSPKTTPGTKSPAHKKTQKSPVRIPFMQVKQSSQTKVISPFVNNQTGSGPKQTPQVTAKRGLSASRVELVRMSTARDSERSGFLRQLTFIKESPSLIRQRAAMPSSRSVPTSQCASPRKTQSGAPAVFLCSSRCQDLKPLKTAHQCKAKEPEIPRGMSAERISPLTRPARRTNSESPSRIIQKKPTATWQKDKQTFKRHSSSPHIDTLKRASSPCSVVSSSSSSESSGKMKSMRGGTPTGQIQKPPQVYSHPSSKVTWRRIKDEDVPHILKSTLPSTALPLAPSPTDGHRQLPPTIEKHATFVHPPRKTSDATVQTEDFSTTRINSSTSPTIERVPIFGETAAKCSLYRKISVARGDGLLVPDVDSGDKAGSFKGCSGEAPAAGMGLFRQSSPSRAVRVTPFNYIPSPMACGSQNAQAQALTLNEKPAEKLEA